MPSQRSSLLAGRNTRPLTQQQIRRASNVFLGLEHDVNTIYDGESKTKFRVSRDGEEEYGEIVFAPDIYPGGSVIDPNSALSLDAAAAHELAHYHRWRALSAVNQDHLEHIDEALTSLEAYLRYEKSLGPTDLRTLVSDAIQRLQLYVQTIPAVSPSTPETSETGNET